MLECKLITRLQGGRSCATGEAAVVAAEVLARPELFEELFAGLKHEETLVRMRAAYAISKIADKRPEMLQTCKKRFIDWLDDPAHPHLCRACMLEALRKIDLTSDDIALLTDILRDFMCSESSIVKTLSLNLLVDFAAADARLRPQVIPLLWDALERGTPAMRARARKLMKKYKI